MVQLQRAFRWLDLENYQGVEHPSFIEEETARLTEDVNNIMSLL